MIMMDLKSSLITYIDVIQYATNLKVNHDEDILYLGYQNVPFLMCGTQKYLGSKFSASLNILIL